MSPPASKASTCAGASDGQVAFMRATTPATCGEAIEVPASHAYAGTRVPLDASTHVEAIRWVVASTSPPGAATSTAAPKLEYDAFVPPGPTAETEMTPAYDAGYDGVLALSLPAAATSTT